MSRFKKDETPEVPVTSPSPGDRVFGHSWDPDRVKTYRKEIARK